MLTFLKKTQLAAAIAGTLALWSCSGGDSSTAVGTVNPLADSLATDTITPVKPLKIRVKFNSPEQMMAYMAASPDSARFAQGVLPRMIKTAPAYADSILNSPFDKFIVVDKAKMRVFVFDSCGVELVNYRIAVGKGAGNKQKKGDCRTPEGYFTAEGIYDSTKWLYTDDDGVTSPVKGQFGPRYIRLRSARRSFPIGIHGTCAPWSIGGRRSHGCIRLANEDILALVEYAEKGMPIMVLPSARDQKANKEDGKLSLTFVTSDSIPDAHPYFPPESSFLPQEPADSIPAQPADSLPQPSEPSAFPVAPVDSVQPLEVTPPDEASLPASPLPS